MKKSYFYLGGGHLDKNEMANKLIELFPEKGEALKMHYQDYGELLGHVFFAEEMNEPLIEILRYNRDVETINKYCSFILEMWKFGSDEVVNIVDVTILERLSDENEIWFKFGNYISDEFRLYINEVILKENNMMTFVPRL